MKFKRKLEMRDWLNITVILALIGLFIRVSANYTKSFGTVDFGDLLSSAENLRQYILSYGNASLLIIVFMHALHVIISFIPSVLVEFVGGALLDITPSEPEVYFHLLIPIQFPPHHHSRWERTLIPDPLLSGR